MGAPTKLKNPRMISAEVEEDILEEFNKIWRRDGLSGKSELLRKVITEYVVNHAEGNDSFKLDSWQEDPEFKALPAFMSPKEKWLAYIKEQTDKEERLKILETSNYISGIIKNIFYNESLKK